MLLNWDANEIYFSSATTATSHGISLPAAKNLVLELTYSVAHRIQALIKELCQRTIKSISNTDKSHNPVAICCALWIVFTATRKFEKYNFTAGTLKNLVRAIYPNPLPLLAVLRCTYWWHVQRYFLDKLHERSKAAIRSINESKWMTSARCCGHTRDNQGDFAKWITEAKRPKSTVSFAFERHVANLSLFLQRNDIDYG